MKGNSIFKVKKYKDWHCHINSNKEDIVFKMIVKWKSQESRTKGDKNEMVRLGY